MPKPDARRWLQVAIKASEFGVLSSANELSPVADRARATAHALRVTRDTADEAREHWRAQLSAPQFHVGLDQQFRQFGHHLSQLEAQQAAQDQQAQHRLDEDQAALRQRIAQKNGLKSAFERSQAAVRTDLFKQQQRADDDTWSARQSDPTGSAE